MTHPRDVAGTIPGPARIPTHLRPGKPSPSLWSISRQGSREENEDCIYVSDDHRLLILADGMGGRTSGQVASHLATEVVAEYLSLPELQLQTGPFATAAGGRLAGALQRAHTAVSGASQRVDAFRGMGTALGAALIADNWLCTAHVGDVRCYLRSRSGFRAITRDHSLVDQWVRQGRMTSEEARLSSQRKQLLQAIGASRQIEPETNTAQLEAGDWVLVCSDGLWGAMPDAALAAVISGAGSVREKAEDLARTSRRSGSRDDISLILYQHDQAPYSF